VRQRIEVLATVLLAVGAVATAWSGYQATRWNGEQAKASGTTNKIRIDAARAQGLSQAQTQIDVATFTQWVDAYALDRTELADFYFKRFRTEFRPAVEAWIATRPLKNAKAPLTPFAMPHTSSPRPPNYILGVVLFSVALFFAGMSTKLSRHAPRNDHIRARLRRVSRHLGLDRD
jgi:hypothetical protein